MASFEHATRLDDKLGPILFQLPPRFPAQTDRLQTFLNALQPHIERTGTRCALEVRDPSWLASPILEMLSEYNVCLCLADWRDMPVTGPLTANFVYVRRHAGSYGGNYTRRELDEDIERARRWLETGRDVYIYFNNDWNGYAIGNAEYVKNGLIARG